MMLLELNQELMARDVLTRLRWLRRLSMMMLFSVTIATTRDATPLMSPTMSLNKRKTVRKTSKTCFIEYEQIAFNETVKVCRQP